jgi:hypothetical protein
MKINKNKALLALFILPLAFDFRGESAGGSWQLAMTGLTVAAWMGFLFTESLIKPQGKMWHLIFLAVVVTLAGSVVSFLLNDAPLDAYIRVIIPWGLLFMGMTVAATEVYRGHLRAINGLLLWGCTLSAIFTLVIGFALTGVAVAEIRYQILSPVILLFEAILLNQLLVEKRRTAFAVIALLACLAVQILSATRSTLLGFALIFIAVVWISSRSIPQLAKNSIRYSAALGIVAAGALSVAMLFYPEIIDRWLARIFSFQDHGVDVTSVSRIAEAEDQLNQWGESLVTLLIGKGYGAPFGYASRHLLDLSAVTPMADLMYQSATAAGHNFYVHSLFAGGILFGLALPAAIIYAAFRGMNASRRYIKVFGTHPMAMTLSRSTLMLVAAIGQTIGGNPLGPRYSGLLLGIAFGMLAASYRHLYKSAPRYHLLRTPRLSMHDRPLCRPK